jgi:hypothetical protein
MQTGSWLFKVTVVSERITYIPMTYSYLCINDDNVHTTKVLCSLLCESFHRVLYGVGAWSFVLLLILHFKDGTRTSVCLTTNTFRKKVLLSLRGNSGLSSKVRWFVLRHSVKLRFHKTCNEVL